jgi:V/A-type H+-transporting ATPase subunit K
MTGLEFAGQLSMGLVLAGAATGSALGIGAAGQAAAGAWAKDSKAGKPLNFSYIILTSLPLTQTIYGFILMLIGLSPLITGANAVTSTHPGTLLGVGIAGAFTELFSAWMQGLIGAAGCRCISGSEGKGLAFIIISMGIVETVGLFGFIFLLLVLP